MLTAPRGWAAVLPASAIVAMVFVVGDLGSPLRPLVTLWFLLFCPGMAVVRLLGIRDRLGKLMLAIVLSVALATVTALAMIYANAWSPPRGVGLLAALTLVATLLPLVSPQPRVAVAMRDLWRRDTFERFASRARLRVLLAAQAVLGVVGLTSLASRVLWWITGRGQRARTANVILPAVRAVIPAQNDLPPPTEWTALRPLPTVGDRMVFLMGPRRQPPVAIAKLIPRDHVRSNLERETETITALQADSRLGDWQRMLPQVLAYGEAGGMDYRVERLIIGVPATTVLRKEDVQDRFQATAAATISLLHRRTATRDRVDTERLRSWVDDPSDALLELCDARTGWHEYRPAIERMRAGLRKKLLNRVIALSWIHGDYWPANILVSDDAMTVTGIVDWDLAEADGLPLLDVMHLILSMRMIAQKQELGIVVRSLLRDPDWTRQERAIVAAAWESLPGERIGMRELMLLSWLRHVVTTRTKTERFSGPLLWDTQNVERVLEVL